MNLLAATTKNKKAINEVYNVVSNDRTSLNKLYQMIEEKLLKSIRGLEKKNQSTENLDLAMLDDYKLV